MARTSADDVVNPAAAFVLQLDRDIARVGLGDRRKTELQAGAPRSVFHFGNGLDDIFHVRETRLVSCSELPGGMT